MKYSLWNFKDWFEKKNISLTYRISASTAPVSQLLFGNGNAGNSGDQAFITGDDPRLHTSGFRSMMTCRQDWLMFPVESAESVYNSASEMISYYEEQEERILDAVVSKGSITSVLNQIRKVFPCPLAVVCPDRTEIYTTKDWEPDPDENFRRAFLQEISRRKDIRSIFYIKLRNVRIKNFGVKFLASPEPSWLLFYDPENRLNPGDLHILSETSVLLASAFRYQASFSDALHPLYQWFSEILSSRTSDVQPASNALAHVRWDKKDYYRITFLKKSGAGDPDLSSLLATLTDPGHCCVYNDGGIAVLTHLGSTYQASWPEEEQRCREFAGKNHLQAGVSLAFRGLSGLLHFYEQARYALIHEKRKTSGVSYMKDILPDYMLKKCRSLENIRAYVHPDIRKLQEIDRKENQQLLETLYTYLVLGRSCVHTAQALDIHRNTLRTRLAKLQSLVSFPIDDNEDIEHILLSLIICGDSARKKASGERENSSA